MASWRSMTKIAGSASGSISQRHGSADPDPDPDHTKMSWIRNTAEKSNLDLPNRIQANIRIVLSMWLFDLSPKLKVPIKTDHTQSDTAYRKYRSVFVPTYALFHTVLRTLWSVNTLGHWSDSCQSGHIQVVKHRPIKRYLYAYVTKISSNSSFEYLAIFCTVFCR